MKKDSCSTFLSSLAELCGRERTREKWLIAPTRRVGQQWLDQLARRGVCALNARVQTMRGLALWLAAPETVSRRGRMLSALELKLLVGELWTELRQGKEDGYLFSLRPEEKMIAALTRTIQELRQAGVSPAELRGFKGGAPAKMDELAGLLEAYERRLNERGRWDLAEVLKAAMRQLDEGQALAGGEALLVAAPESFRQPWEKELWSRWPEEKRCELVAQTREAPGAPTVEFFSAKGEVNEVREVLHRLVGLQIPLDQVELLHTDRQTYVPLIFETLVGMAPDDQPDLPVTFEEGLEIRYARPGRALLGWLEWIRTDYQQSTLVRMIQDGLLEFIAQQPGPAHSASFARRAALLREIEIIRGRGRYAKELSRAVLAAQRRSREEGDPEHPEQSEHRREVETQRLGILLEINHLIQELLDEGETELNRPRQLLIAARRFVEHQARTVNRLDRFARRWLLRELRAMSEFLEEEQQESGFDALEWLSGLVAEGRVGGEGPRPGCLYVTGLESGGHSGRPYTFIIGLDDTRLLGGARSDPLLLDEERARLSPRLPPSAERLAQKKQNWLQLLGRLDGKVGFSFSAMDLESGRELFPSQLLLEVYRAVKADEKITLPQFIGSLPPAASFVAAQSGECLTMGEWWMHCLCQKSAERFDCREAIEERFAHLRQGRIAVEHREGEVLSEYDGYVPAAGTYRDPLADDGPVLSASRLETYAKSPFDYFLKYVLGLEPPREFEEEQEWPSSLARGTMLHEALCEFMRRLQEAGKLPPCQERDSKLLDELLAEKLELFAASYPPPNGRALKRELDWMREAGAIFLREEEERAGHFLPYAFEVSIGIKKGPAPSGLDREAPLPVYLNGLGTIKLRGAIDRLDLELRPDGPRYEVWDYKSSRSISKYLDGPFNQGRMIQPYIYKLLSECVLPTVDGQKVSLGRFGYYFPTPYLLGRRVFWDAQELEEGEELVASMVRMMRSGIFCASDCKDDLRYSDYAECYLPDPQSAAAQAKNKILDEGDEGLSPLHGLRGKNVQEE